MDLLIFDCDGVLVDSEIIACEIDAACLTAAGFPISVEEVSEHYIGVRTAEMLADIERKHGRRLPAGFADLLLERTLAAFDRELKAVPGMPELLAQLAAPLCVASGSDPERIRHSLHLVGLLDYFEPNVFSAAMVARGKPAPDLYLLVAERMGRAPEACLAVEDSVAGVSAARAAGMEVIGFVAGRHCGAGLGARLEAAGAAAVASSSPHLLDLLTP
jgi:HAD superfamily hydrolase (TIGR01509 family)